MTISDSEFSRQVDNEIIEFDEWQEIDGNEDLEQFIEERKLDSAVAEQLRNLGNAEKQFAGLGPKTSNEPTVSTSPENDLSGKTIGDFHFTKRIGVGGMGEVWLAQQLSPVKRQVAIKLIRVGMDSDAFVKRFEVEQQAMASMSHPNIARVLDVGTLDGVRQYLAMEFVPGKPITEYCNQHRLSLKQRLELFLQLCNAIQHAHQKSLLHRDIKPTNVMVSDIDGKPHVKVIDFGLSKVLTDNGSTDANITQIATAVGSPLWMSPEQAKGINKRDGSKIDTRSDIYSLGVVLYQLITNSTPITEEVFSNATMSQLLKMIEEQVIPYPSARLNKDKKSNQWIEKQTSSSFGSWSNTLKNDLDWVTNKALEKDRDRRYPTVTALSDDVNRFINNEPVFARPPSKRYRLTKLARKHRGTAFTIVGLAAILLLTTLVSTWMAVWALREREVAKLERNKAEVAQTRTEQIVNFLVRGFGKLDAAEDGAQYNEFKIDYLNSIKSDIDAVDFAGDGLAEASLRYPLALSLSGAGEHQNAVEQLERVLKLNEQATGGHDDVSIEARTRLASEFIKLRTPRKALELAEESLQLSQKLHDDTHPLSLDAKIVFNLAHANTGELNAPIEELRRVIPLVENELGKNHRLVADAKAALAFALFKKLEYKDASERYAEAKEISSTALGENHERTLELEVLYWDALASDEKFRAADELKRTFENIAKKFGPGHPLTLRLRDLYGAILLRERKHEEAAAIHLESIATGTKQLGEDHFQIALTSLKLADVYYALRKYDEVLALMDKISPSIKANFGEGSAEFLRAQYMIGDTYFFGFRDYEKSLAVAKKYVPVAKKNLGKDALILSNLTELLARSLMECNQTAEAMKTFEESIALSISRNGEESTKTAQAYFQIGYALCIKHEVDKGIDNMEKGIEILKKSLGIAAGDTHGTTGILHGFLLSRGKYARAEFHIRTSMDNLAKDANFYAALMPGNQIALPDALAGQSKYAEARKAAEEILNQEPFTTNPMFTARLNSVLGACLTHEKKYKEAEAKLKEALETFDPEELNFQTNWFRRVCLERLVTLYKSWQRPEEAKKYLERLNKFTSETSGPPK